MSSESLANDYLSDGHCVDVSSAKKTWSDASDMCVSQNGSLAIITTNETLEFIQTTLSNVSDGYTGGYWIGGYEAPRNDSWKWHTSKWYFA